MEASQREDEVNSYIQQHDHILLESQEQIKELEKMLESLRSATLSTESTQTEIYTTTKSM